MSPGLNLEYSRENGATFLLVRNCGRADLPSCDFGVLLAFVLVSRGGVDDTRLKAKAKDTKKIRGQGQGSPSEDKPSQGQGQECSRPRPTTKDTNKSVHQKKKVFKKCL